MKKESNFTIKRENTEMGLPKNPRPEALQAPLLRFSIQIGQFPIPNWLTSVGET